MSGPLAQAGAISDPTRYGALSMAGEQFTGLWTQAGPYRDAASPYLVRKFYSGSRFDRMIDGINREITAKLTDGRRPGTATYNSQLFGAVRSFYSFKYVQNSQEKVKVMVDTDTEVDDASNNAKVNIYSKPAGAGRTRFLGIGATLYMGNGATQKKWLQGSYAWQPSSSNFADGTKFIVDTNLNIQQAVKAQTFNIVQIQVTNGPGLLHTLFLYYDSKTPLGSLNSVGLTLAGLTTRASLNGLALPATNVEVVNILETQSIVAAGVATTGGIVAETGTATTGTGVTGSSQPAWATNPGDVTVDGTQQWICKGSALQNWGISAPPGILALTQAPLPNSAAAWQASTFYAPLMIIQNSGILYKLTTDGVTGASTPSFDPVVGHTTSDGSAVWTSLGASAWASGTVYAVGSVVQNSYSYSITTTTYQYDYNTHTVTPITTTQTITVTSLFLCVTAGTSGSNPPSWNNGVGTTTQDNTVQWQNMGSFIPQWSNIGATQNVAKETQVQGSGYFQNVQQFGKTGTTAPTWSTSLGGYTADNGNTYMWKNSGQIAPGTPAGPWIYGYSGKNSITGEISTSSPISSAINVAVGNAPILTGVGLADSQIDQLVLWRTTQGGATLIYLDTIVNPGAGQTFIYTDTTLDANLNPLQPAPIDNANDPPVSGFTGPVFYLGRVWGFKDNVVYYSQAQGATTGSAYSAFPPLNQFVYPGSIIKLQPITVQGGALLVFTSSGIYIVLGSGTASDPFISKRYAEKINLLNFDSLDVFGSQIFLMEQNYKVSSITVQYPFNPQSGYDEVGYPIGDQFLNVTTGAGSALTGQLYQGGYPYLSWNPQSTQDNAMYVADGNVGWFRMGVVSPPETGLVWNPRAAIVGGTSAVQNVETAPGVFNLLIGGTGNTPILMRETNATGFSYADHGTAFPAWDVKGVTLLCSTGQTTEVAHIATKSAAVGARPTIWVLLGEIAASSKRPWVKLSPTSNDPALTRKSLSVFSDQYDLAQNGRATETDSIQTKFDYGTQAVADELLDWGLYGSTSDERKEESQRGI